VSQLQFTEQDAASLVEKIAAFTETLTPGEQAAWQAIEQHISTLVPTEDEDVSGFMIPPDSAGAMAEAHQRELRDEVRRSRAGRTPDQRRTLWNRLVTTLTPPRG
jgi:hypothetical protein